jgi:hypothetical protein
MTAVLVSQVPEPAKERTTYIITTPGGEFPVFWDEAESRSGQDWVRVEVDEPWNPRVWTGKRSSVTGERRERPSAREQRIKEGYEQHGYAQVNGRFVPKAEVDLAKRARAMAGLEAPAENVAAPPPPVKVITPSDGTIPDLPPPSVLKRWAPHAGLVVVAALLLLLVGRTLLT